MIDKIVESADAALQGMADGATVLVSGFGDAGVPHQLLQAQLRQGARELTVITNNAGIGETGIGALLAAGRVRKLVCSFPREWPDRVRRAVCQGRGGTRTGPARHLERTDSRRGGRIGGHFTRTGAGTVLAEGKEARVVDGHTYVFESPFKCDFAPIKAERGDRWGNLTYRLSARNFAPVMASAARLTIAQVREVVERGQIAPEEVVTPGIVVAKIWRAA
jgi:3-oxoadipate CoA-transferase alpha subunit